MPEKLVRTGGYNSIQNPLGELFHRLGQEGMGALLSQATGCDPYYLKSLWLLTLKQAAYWLKLVSKLLTGLTLKLGSPLGRSHGGHLTK